MGFFGKVFGSKSDYPAVGADSPLADQLHMVEEPLRALMQKVSDRLEVVPAEGRTYIFIGKPPKHFGIAWIENGELVNLQLLAKEHGLSAGDMQNLSDKLRAAYEHTLDVQRYSASMAGREIVVTPSPQLEQEVQQIIDSAIQ